MRTALEYHALMYDFGKRDLLKMSSILEEKREEAESQYLSLARDLWYRKDWHLITKMVQQHPEFSLLRAWATDSLARLSLDDITFDPL
ncbi:MAG: hypothetical protein AAGM67_05395, partial [Bacteroidota bacterium]